MIIKLKKKLIELQKSRDTKRVEVYRYFLSLIQNREIELRPSGVALTDEEIFKILRKQVKNLKETIKLYEEKGVAQKLEEDTQELEIYKEISKEFFPQIDLEASFLPPATGRPRE